MTETVVPSTATGCYFSCWNSQPIATSATVSVVPNAASAPLTQPRTPTAWTARLRPSSAKEHAGGATLDEIVAATSWQKHSVRGFISTLGSKHGYMIVSARRESDKARVYAIQS
jgi:hypothetical protein